MAMELETEWGWAAEWVLAMEWVLAVALVLGWGGGLPHTHLQKFQLHKLPP